MKFEEAMFILDTAIAHHLNAKAARIEAAIKNVYHDFRDPIAVMTVKNNSVQYTILDGRYFAEKYAAEVNAIPGHYAEITDARTAIYNDKKLQKLFK